MLSARAAMLSIPREVMAGRPCVTSMHRDLIPVASKGVGHFGLSGIKDLTGSGLAEGFDCEKY